MNNFLFLIVLFCSSSLGAKTGFFSGAFDPPDSSDIELIRSSLHEKQLDKIIIMVERIHSDGYLASSLERMEILHWELADIKDRVHIIVEPWSGKNAYLAESKDELYILEKKQNGIPILSKTIQDKRLYTNITSSMEVLKKSLFQETFTAFLRQISYFHPKDTIQNTPLPYFKPLMSHLGWVDQFIYSVIRERHFNKERADAFGNKAEKLLISSVRGEPYAKLHGIREVSFDQLPKPLTQHTSFSLPVHPTDQKHTLDIETYCSDRFPNALFASFLFQEDDTYFHVGSTQEAIAFHQAEGFNEIYEVFSQAVRKLRNYHLVKNPATNKFRFIVSNLRGEDTLRHVAYQFNAIAKFQQIHLVRHLKPSSLIEISPSHSFQSNDTLIIGFKNATSRLLRQNSVWQETPLTSSGVEEG